MGYVSQVGRPRDLGASPLPLPSDLAPNNWVPVGNGYVSQVESYTDYERPIPQRTDLFARHVNYVGFATMLSSMGFTYGCATPTIGHYEEPWIEDVIKVKSIITASSGAGTNVVIELDDSNMYNSGVTVSGVARKGSYPQKGDTFELYDRTKVYVVSKDVTTDPHRITIRPVKAAVDLAGKITVGDEYGIGEPLFAENTGLPSGRQPRIMKYANEFSLLKSATKATGFELTNAIYHETIPGDAGSVGGSIYIKVKYDEMRRHEKNKGHALLFGQTIDNITDTATESGVDTPVISTEGFVEFALTSGAIDEYTVGSLALDDLYVVSNVYYDERVLPIGSPDVMAWTGPEYGQEMEQTFTQTLVQNPIYTVDRIIEGYGGYLKSQSYAESLDHKETDATLSFGYSAVQVNGIIFHFKRLDELGDTRRFGGYGYPYRNYAMYTPLMWKEDLLTPGRKRATVGYEYKQLGPYSRENVVGTLAGAGVGGSNTPYGPAVNEYDSMKGFMLSHIAGHFAVGNAIVTQRPS